MRQQIILLHTGAPTKPAEGQACNGCGVCCAFAPCPLGQWLSRKRHGACVALQWQADARHYRCGAVATPGRFMPWLPEAWGRQLALRWISAAKGCDSNLEIA